MFSCYVDPFSQIGNFTKSQFTNFQFENSKFKIHILLVSSPWMGINVYDLYGFQQMRIMYSVYTLLHCL
jgi:hypothetical protein